MAPGPGFCEYLWRGAPYHPQAQGKIERWHQMLKNRILLENYYLSGGLRHQIDAFVEHYNHQRYHESLQNLTSADVYFGRGQAVLKQREKIKRKIIETRLLLHRKSAAQSNQPDGSEAQHLSQFRQAAAMSSTSHSRSRSSITCPATKDSKCARPQRHIQPRKIFHQQVPLFIAFL